MIILLHAVQRAVLGFRLLVGTQLQGNQCSSGETLNTDKVPAAELDFHYPAKQAVQKRSRWLAFQTFGGLLITVP